MPENDFPKSDGHVLYASEINGVYNAVKSTIHVAIAAEKPNCCYDLMSQDRFTSEGGAYSTVCTDANTTSLYDGVSDVYTNGTYNTDIYVCDNYTASGSGTDQLCNFRRLRVALELPTSTQQNGNGCAYSCYDTSCCDIDLNSRDSTTLVINQVHTWNDNGFAIGSGATYSCVVVEPGLFSCCLYNGHSFNCGTPCVCSCTANNTLFFSKQGTDDIDVYLNGVCICNITAAQFDFNRYVCGSGSGTDAPVIVCGCADLCFLQSISSTTCFRTCSKSFDICPKAILLETNCFLGSGQCIRYDVYDSSSNTTIATDLCDGVAQCLPNTTADEIYLVVKQCSSNCATYQEIRSYGYHVF